MQVVHAPFLTVEKSLRNWPVGHVGWATHLPDEVAESPERYVPALHAGCELHLNPLDVPLQLPARYLPSAHLTLLHVAHAPLAVDEEPLRY